MKLECKHVGLCGGCPRGMREFAPEEKARKLREIFPAAQIRYSPHSRVRDRADLIWENVNGEMRLGLYALNSRETVALSECPQMSVALESWFHEFKKLPPPIKKGSVRLRVSPSGQRGVWLDFANQDVKALFDEKNYLTWLSERAFVEIGQRRKVLTWKEGAPKLVAAELRPWFETYNAEFKPLALFGPVGGFSQAGFAANRELVAAVTEAVKASGENSWLELFCGNGNFALALAARGLDVEAVELEPLAVEGLKLSLLQAGLTIKLHTQDVYLKAKNLPEFGGRGLLVDPPRAGMREILEQIRHRPRPSALIYVSCFEESFLADVVKLNELGFELESLVGVDQFPWSEHMEWVARFKRSLL